ncbi:MAG: dTDP-4-dehydrorhamnose reductase [Candidatus Acidiferrales bacterium]
MKPKILLVGKNGQVGADLATLLPAIGQLVTPGRQQLNLANPAEIRRVIQQVQPRLIVNAAAYTAVDKAETEESLARAINADAPAVMAEEAKKIGAALVHYSTDYVFDGTKTSPYEEDDATGPINVYGSTKLAGERAVQSSGVPCLVLRTSWVYSTRGSNFLLAILRLASQREELRIVRDQIGAPTASQQIARGTVEILKLLSKPGENFEALQANSGIYHMTASGETSWYEFAKAILEEALRLRSVPPWFAAAAGGHSPIARRVIPIATSEYPTPARRPAYSVLSNARLASAFGLQLPEWREQLQRVFQTI